MSVLEERPSGSLPVPQQSLSFLAAEYSKQRRPRRTAGGTAHRCPDGRRRSETVGSRRRPIKANRSGITEITVRRDVVAFKDRAV